MPMVSCSGERSKKRGKAAPKRLADGQARLGERACDWGPLSRVGTGESKAEAVDLRLKTTLPCAIPGVGHAGHILHRKDSVSGSEFCDTPELYSPGMIYNMLIDGNGEQFAGLQNEWKRWPRHGRDGAAIGSAPDQTSQGLLWAGMT